MENLNGATFFFLNGPFEQPTSKELEGIYEGTCYGYIPYDRFLAGKNQDEISEVMRDVQFQKVMEDAYNLLYDVLEEQGPFDGFIGFSHGATLAFAFLMQHAKKNPLDPPFALLRCAVFISSSAPPSQDGARIRYDEKTGTLLSLPSLHVTGKADPMFQDSLNLYRLCEKHTAKLVCHSGGHCIPRDRSTTIALAKAIEDLVSRSTIM